MLSEEDAPGAVHGEGVDAEGGSASRQEGGNVASQLFGERIRLVQQLEHDRKTLREWEGELHMKRKDLQAEEERLRRARDEEGSRNAALEAKEEEMQRAEMFYQRWQREWRQLQDHGDIALALDSM